MKTNKTHRAPRDVAKRLECDKLASAFQTPKSGGKPTALQMLARIHKALFLFSIFTTLPALGQWAIQTIVLRPGWNAVFLEVQPEPRDCDLAFSNLPVESVWAWNRRSSAVQFIQNPEETLMPAADWLTYAPPDKPARSTRTLYSLIGGRTYLVKLAVNAGTRTWTFTGRPATEPVHWLSDSYNFVGFPVDPASPSTFQNFFSGSPAHAGQPIHRLNTAGQWEKVTSPGSTVMRSGEAFWVRCEGQSSWPGPLVVQTAMPAGMDYGSALAEQVVRFRNLSAAPRTLTLRPLASAPPPLATLAPVAGAVPLSHYGYDVARRQFTWTPLAGVLTETNLPPGGEWVLRLATRRSEMPAVGAGDAVYQSLLEVRDGVGNRRAVPVSAVASDGQGRVSVRGLARDAAANSKAGLWVGSVTINTVSQPGAADGDKTTTRPVAPPFQFRLILHVDAANDVRLLSKVIQVFNQGEYEYLLAGGAQNAGTNNLLGIEYLKTPGAYTLYQHEDDVPSGKAPPFARRISSAVFTFPDPLLMVSAASFNGTNSVLTGVINNTKQNVLNPFTHRYHTNHQEAVSFDFVNALTLKFAEISPPPADPEWGNDVIGGDYEETITGLHRDPLNAKGTFRLRRLATTPTLN